MNRDLYHQNLYPSDVAEIRTLVMKHPRDTFGDQETIHRQWKEFGYLGPPDFSRSLHEYDAFLEMLQELGLDIHFLCPDERVGLDSIYVRDASIVSREGMILCNMGKPARRWEPMAQEAFFHSLGIPILGAIQGRATLEGGDVVWLDPKTLAVARSYRTNDEGIHQLRDLLGDSVEEFIVVPLPHWRGPADVFHLMSIISPIDEDLALIYSPLTPIPFREALLRRSIQLVEVPDEEFESLGCNVLAVSPRKCVMLAGNSRTRRRLEAAGVEVLEFEGREISLKGGGGPTCLTRPIQRVRPLPDSE